MITQLALILAFKLQFLYSREVRVVLHGTKSLVVKATPKRKFSYIYLQRQICYYTLLFQR